MQYLKADTNTEVLIGPVVAVGDGFTPVTTLATGTADEAELIKYGGATPLTVTSISASAMTAITGADGYYTLDLSTGNTDTEGFLTVLFNDDSLCLPVRHDFMVVNANVYDSLFSAATTDYLQVDTLQLAGTTQDATDLADFAAAGYDPGTNKVQGVVLTDTTTAVTNQVTANATAISGSSAAADAMEVNYTGTVTAFDGLNDVSLAGVNGEVANVLKTDTVTEPTQGIPPLAATMEDMITYIYLEYVRNRVIVDNTAGDKEIYADDGTTVLYRKTLSDTGSILTVAEATSGP